MGEHFTDIQMITFELKWEIKKIIAFIAESYDCETKIELDSPSFSVKINNHDTKWCLRFVVDYSDNSDNSERSSSSNNSFYSSQSNSDECGSNNDYGSSTLAFYLIRQRGKTKPRMRIMTETYFFTEEGRQFWELSAYHKIYGKNPNEIYSDNADYFMNLAGINQLSNSIKIVCQINVIGDTITSEENCLIHKVPEVKITEDLNQLLENEKLSDITFILDNERIKAHKAILAARSPVFAALFDNPMKEQSENEVNIEDIDVDIFKKMLQYIYTNEVTNLEDGAMKLLYAADKYALGTLKEICGVSLWQKITVDNSVEALIFADRHSLNDLVECISTFIKTHISDVVETSEFKAMEMENPQLANKIYRKLLQNSI